MATKKGIVITIGILVAITASSFLIWIIPQNNQNINVNQNSSGASKKDWINDILGVNDDGNVHQHPKKNPETHKTIPKNEKQ